MNDLFSLIKNLTTAERQQFALFVKRQSKSGPDDEGPMPGTNKEWEVAPEKKYWQLFMAYSKLGEKSSRATTKDEKKIQAALGSDNAQFGVLKNYLSKLLFDFLRPIYRPTGVELQLKELFDEAKILEERGLLDWSLKKLNKVYAEAKKYEVFYLAAEAVYRIVLIMVRTGKFELKEIDPFFDNLKEIWLNERSEMAYRRDNYLLFLPMDGGGAVGHQKKMEMLDDLEQEIGHRGSSEPPLNFKAMVAYFSSKNQIAQFKGNDLDAFESLKSSALLFDQYPHVAEASPLIAYAYLGNYLGRCILYHFLQDAEVVIEKMKKISEKTAPEKVARLLNLDLNYFLFLINSNRLQDAMDEGLKIEEKFRTFKNQISNQRKINFLANHLMLFMLLENYELAQERLAEYFRGMPTAGTRDDLHIAIRLLHLVIFYGLGDTEPILDTQAALKLKIKKLKLNNLDFERKTVETLFQMVNAPDKKGKKRILKSFVAFLDETQTREDFVPPPGFDLIVVWANAKLEDVTLAIVYQRKLEEIKNRPLVNRGVLPAK